MENNNGELGLFDRPNAGANDWQVVNNAEKEAVAETAPPPAAVAPAPQVWDDIPREEAAPQPEISPEQEIAADAQPEAVPEPAIVAPRTENPEFSPVSDVAVAQSQEAPVSEDPVYRFVAPAEISTLAEMGQYLAQMRQKVQLSSAEVSEATKIRPDYLAAIENGDASELPQAVYVLAYIRKLCELYSVDTANLNEFFEDLRDGFSYELPEDINKSIVGHENDEEQDKKVRRLAIGLISAAAIVIVALIIGIVALLVTLTKNTDSSCAASDRKIMEYQGKPTLFLQKLPPKR